MMRKQKAAFRSRFIECLEARRCMSAEPLGASLAQPDAATQAQISHAYGQLPLSFEANQGQTDAQVDFLSRGSGYTLFLTPAEAVLSLGTGETNDVVRMRIVGADPNARSAVLEAESGRTNYLVGSDSSQWHTDVANYGRVEYQDVYSGIDIVYYGNQRRLEYDFLVAPGVDPNVIQLAFDGVQNMELDSGSNLILHTAGGDLVKDAPVIYQEIDGARSSIAGRYLLDDGQVSFEVGAYDHALPLVIDPILSYSTYLGGRTGDDGYSIAVDSMGNAYIIGDTVSTNFPTNNSLQPRLGSQQQYDAFVAKLNPAGTALVYSTYLGGNGFDRGEGIAVDAAGNAFVTGETNSSNFPTTGNAFQTSYGGGSFRNAFMAKLNASGSALLYSTYLGGTATDSGHAITLDGSGNAYVTGETMSANFPTKNALQAAKISPSGSADAFVAKIDPALVGAASLVYSTYLDGSNFSVGLGIVVDGLSNAYVTGYTGSGNFPTTSGAYQTIYAGGDDCFVTKIISAGSALVFSTYLGGSGSENQTANPRAGGIAVNAFGNAYVTGNTNSINFPTSHDAFQQVFGGGQYDAFVVELNPAGSTFVYSTYLGGNLMEQVFGIALDGSGNAYVTGTTTSANFPTKNPLQPKYGGGGYDAFVTKISPTPTQLATSSARAMSQGTTATPLTLPQGNNLEFVQRGNRGEQHRMDLLTVVMHEFTHVLDHDHDADGVMAATLAMGVRRIDIAPSYAERLDQVFSQFDAHPSNPFIGDLLDEPLNSSRSWNRRRR